MSGDLGGFTIDPSRASVTVDFLDANGVTLGTGALQPVTADRSLVPDRLINATRRARSRWAPAAAQVVVTLTDLNPVLGNYNNAYADDVSFTSALRCPPLRHLYRRRRRSSQLDHVFLVYMENKGVTDIVGSPNAPYR